MKKSGFLTFIFAFIPGAAHMYLGMMKKGSVLMTAFFAAIFISAFTRIEVLMFILPVIFFYAFFDALNMRHAPYEALMLEEDKFSKALVTLMGKDWAAIAKKQHVYVGWAFVVLGVYLTFRNFIDPIMYQLYEFMPNALVTAIRNLPTLAISFAIILLGIYIVKGKKDNSPKKDFVEFGGNKDDN